VNDLARTPEDRQAIEFLYAGTDIGRPFLAPLGLAPDMLTMLRDAFSATMTDPEFLADARKQKLDVTPEDGEHVAAIVRRITGALAQHSSHRSRCAFSPWSAQGVYPARPNFRRLLNRDFPKEGRWLKKSGSAGLSSARLRPLRALVAANEITGKLGMGLKHSPCPPQQTHITFSSRRLSNLRFWLKWRLLEPQRGPQLKLLCWINSSSSLAYLSFHRPQLFS